MRAFSSVLLNDGRKAADLMDIEKGKLTYAKVGGYISAFFF